jgi:2-polyprenyl-3-methyl-5-hydroxy-6-metoxy-1,4-benzoquinol methylase
MAEKHFYEQKEYTTNYLLPYLQKHISNFHQLKVLEIGCAEGGLLEVLQDIGINCIGLEISEERIKIAQTKNSTINIVHGDITENNLLEKFPYQFDVIIMREVIEHLQNKYAAFGNLNSLLKENGFLYVSFPPKYSPFAGHQQIAQSFLKVIPYLHLLPKAVLKIIARSLNEKNDFIDEIKLHYKTGMSINQFELLYMINKFKPIIKELFLFRPIYRYRYGIPKVKVPNVQVLREIYTFGYEILLQKINL